MSSQKLSMIIHHVSLISVYLCSFVVQVDYVLAQFWTTLASFGCTLAQFGHSFASVKLPKNTQEVVFSASKQHVVGKIKKILQSVDFLPRMRTMTPLNKKQTLIDSIRNK